MCVMLFFVCIKESKWCVLLYGSNMSDTDGEKKIKWFFLSSYIYIIFLKHLKKE